MSRRGLEVWPFDGDPASGTRQYIWTDTEHRAFIHFYNVTTGTSNFYSAEYYFVTEPKDQYDTFRPDVYRLYPDLFIPLVLQSAIARLKQVLRAPAAPYIAILLYERILLNRHVISQPFGRVGWDKFPLQLGLIRPVLARHCSISFSLSQFHVVFFSSSLLNQSEQCTEQYGCQVFEIYSG